MYSVPGLSVVKVEAYNVHRYLVVVVVGDRIWGRPIFKKNTVISQFIFERGHFVNKIK